MVALIGHNVPPGGCEEATYDRHKACGHSDQGFFPRTTDIPPAFNCPAEVRASGKEPYVWVNTADQILESLARYCERVSDSGH